MVAVALYAALFVSSEFAKLSGYSVNTPKISEE